MQLTGRKMSALPNAFDATLPGTSNDAWLRVLEEKAAWIPRTESLVIVSAHPGEETLGAAGLMASFRHWRRPVTVISVSDGEAAYREWGGLGELRHVEMLSALHRLCPQGVTVIRLKLPDGQIQRHEAAVRESLFAQVPANALLVAPFEGEGHPDHQALGRICLDAAATLEVRTARYPIWAWHQEQAQGFAGARWGRFELNERLREAKRLAINALGSQLRPPSGRPIVPPHCLAYFERPFEAFLL
jgi:LmbE family N-acetylglucosaminyl deacetylase